MFGAFCITALHGDEQRLTGRGRVRPSSPYAGDACALWTTKEDDQKRSYNRRLLGWPEQGALPGHRAHACHRPAPDVLLQHVRLFVATHCRLQGVASIQCCPSSDLIPPRVTFRKKIALCIGILSPTTIRSCFRSSKLNFHFFCVGCAEIRSPSGPIGRAASKGTRPKWILLSVRYTASGRSDRQGAALRRVKKPGVGAYVAPSSLGRKKLTAWVPLLNGSFTCAEGPQVKKGL